MAGDDRVSGAIRPDEIDSSEAPADDFIEDQFAALNTRATEMQKRLVVFLAGATSPPDRTMTKYLASLGFHVLAPHYSNAYGKHVGAHRHDP